MCSNPQEEISKQEICPNERTSNLTVITLKCIFINSQNTHVHTHTIYTQHMSGSVCMGELTVHPSQRGPLPVLSDLNFVQSCREGAVHVQYT